VKKTERELVERIRREGQSCGGETVKRNEPPLTPNIASLKAATTKFLEVLQETGGAWTDANHPELKTIKDVDRYVREKRRSYRKRMKGLFHQVPPV
jgi:hypothetical protein